MVLSDYLERTDRHRFENYVQQLKTEGLPYIIENDLHIFTLPFMGPHQAVHFLWNQPVGSGHDQENFKLVSSPRKKRNNISKKHRKDMKQKLEKLGITKAYQANYILRDILGDVAYLQNESDEMRLEKVRTLVELDEDVLCDLRINNGRPPKLLTM